MIKFLKSAAKSIIPPTMYGKVSIMYEKALSSFSYSVLNKKKIAQALSMLEDDCPDEIAIKEAAVKYLRGKRVRGCGLIGNSVNFTRNSISHCCGFDNKEDVTRICDFDGGPFPFDVYIKSYKKFIFQNILRQCNCAGCKYLSYIYPPYEFEFFKSLSLNHFWGCNLKCNFCREKNRVGEGNVYNILPVFQELYDKGYMREETVVSWGGGELTLYKYVDEALLFCLERNIPQEIHTSGVLFSELIAQSLKDERSFLRISIDSGTPQTYMKVKGVDCFYKVWENVKRYRKHGKVIVKYVILMDNSDINDLLGFVQKCKEVDINSIEIVPEFVSYAAAHNRISGKKNAYTAIHSKIDIDFYIEIAKTLRKEALSKGISVSLVHWYVEDKNRILS